MRHVGVLTARLHCRGCRGEWYRERQPCWMMATTSINSRLVARGPCCVLAYQQIEVDKDALQASQQCPLDRARRTKGDVEAA